MPSEKVLRTGRLTKTKEFVLVYEKGLFYRCKNLKLWVMPNNLAFNRRGILVSKKNAPTAVAINRIKRLLKEAYRINKHKLKSGFDLIIGCNGPMGNKIKLSEIQNNLLGIFKKACLSTGR